MHDAVLGTSLGEVHLLIPEDHPEAGSPDPVVNAHASLTAEGTLGITLTIDDRLVALPILVPTEGVEVLRRMLCATTN